MIYYETGWSGCNFLFQWRGSVFPYAFCVALPSSLIALLLKELDNNDLLGDWKGMQIIVDNTAYASFNFLVGFVIVFRTSQAYSRFWSALFDMHQMCAQFFDAASGVVAFCRPSEHGDRAVASFLHTMVRLFSILTAVALQELSDDKNIHIHGYETLDTSAIDWQSIIAIDESDKPVELVFQWIQQLMVDGLHEGIIAAPPPVATRAFQQLASGMVSYHDAMKVAKVPFPFPYAQITIVMLIIHSIITPVVMVSWTSWTSTAGMFTFIPVFTLWAMNYIATDIETPFGGAANDLDPQEMQSNMNKQLALLLDPKTCRTPTLSRGHSSSLQHLGRNLASQRDRVHQLAMQMKVAQVWVSKHRSEGDHCNGSCDGADLGNFGALQPWPWAECYVAGSRKNCRLQDHGSHCSTAAANTSTPGARAASATDTHLSATSSSVVAREGGGGGGEGAGQAASCGGGCSSPAGVSVGGASAASSSSRGRWKPLFQGNSESKQKLDTKASIPLARASSAPERPEAILLSVAPSSREEQGDHGDAQSSFASSTTDLNHSLERLEKELESGVQENLPGLVGKCPAAST